MVQSEKISTPASKRCPRCGVTKSADEFWKRRASSDGLQVWCKSCTRRLDRTVAWNKYSRSHVPERVASNRRRYHEKQEEAGCHMNPRVFWPGYQLIKAFEDAEVVSV